MPVFVEDTSQELVHAILSLIKLYVEGEINEDDLQIILCDLIEEITVPKRNCELNIVLLLSMF